MRWDILIAKMMFKLGVRPRFSHNIAEELSAGYGELDEFGFWEFPLTQQDIQKIIQIRKKGKEVKKE